MGFIEVEKSIRKSDWNMNDLHSHSHIEVYFLLEGVRSFFLTNKFYCVSAPSVIIIPPHILHKTEGGPFSRININVSLEYLDSFQKKILNIKTPEIISLNEKKGENLIFLVNELASFDKSEPFYDCKTKCLFSYIVYELSKYNYKLAKPKSSMNVDTPPLILTIIDYLQSNYKNNITIEDLSQKFFISKGALIYNFNKYIKCSPISFVLNIRLTKAKELLGESKMSIQEIADVCGFSSANYFALIFKKKEGLSPANYRKVQSEKQ